MTVYFPWAVMFILECIGARLYSNRSKLMAVYFAASLFLDAIAFAIFKNCHIDYYAWMAWAAKGLRGLMLIWLACSICGMFVAEKRKSFATLSAAFLSLGSAALITVFASSGETLKDKLLDGEISANMILLGIVALGWIGRRDRLTGAWKWIVAGFVLMVGSDLAFTILWAGMPAVRINSHILIPAWQWAGARHWYPLGAIAAQLIWLIGPLKADWDAKKPYTLPEFRQSLEKQFPKVEKVRIC